MGPVHLQEDMSQRASGGTVETREGRSDEGTGSHIAIAEECGLQILQIWLSYADTLILVIKTCLALPALRKWKVMNAAGRWQVCDPLFLQQRGSTLFRRPGEATHCFKEQSFKYSVKVGGSEGLFCPLVTETFCLFCFIFLYKFIGFIKTLQYKYFHILDSSISCTVVIFIPYYALLPLLCLPLFSLLSPHSPPSTSFKCIQKAVEIAQS